MSVGMDAVAWAILRATDDVLKATGADSDARWGGLFRGEDAATIASAQATYRRKPPTIKRGYARTNERWPVVSIVLAGEDQDQSILGMDSHDEVTGAGTVRNVKAMFLAEAVTIFVHAEGPEIAALLHLVARQVLLGAMQAFADAGFDSLSYSGGRDLSPAESYLPENVWTRVQTWRALEHTETHVASSETLKTIVWLARDDMDRGDGVMGGVVATTAENL